MATRGFSDDPNNKGKPKKPSNVFFLYRDEVKSIIDMKHPGNDAKFALV